MATQTTDQTPTSTSVGVYNEEQLMKLVNNLSKVYTPEEMKAYAFYIRRLEHAKEQRNRPTRYYDGLDYNTAYITNENAKNTHLTPKKNDSEVRVNTGLLEKKIETIVNELLTMNLQPQVRVYDKNDLELEELGQDFSDIVTRTNQIEKDDDLWIEAIYELLTQHAVFIQEKYCKKTLRNGTSTIEIAEKSLLSGLKVFLGDISIPAYRFNEQPYIVTVDIMSFDRAKSLYQAVNPTAWDNVTPDNTKRNEFLGGALNYRFSNISNGEVEIITYRSLPDNEYQVIINGVMMYPPKTPVPFKYADKYDIQMFILKSMSPDFAYGRPLTASAKSLQALSNETIRLLIRKFQQAIEPPMVVAKGKVYSRDIWDPGAVTQGLKAKDFEQLTKHDGVTQGEFAMFNLIEQKTQEFIGASDVAQGLNSSKEMSATQVLTMQKQFIKQLGLAVYAISRMKRDMSELRIYNVLENYTLPTGKKKDPISNLVENIYRSFTIENGTFEDNRLGRKIVQFTDKTLTPEDEQAVYEEEERMAMHGKPTRYKFVNVPKLKEVPQFWYVVVQAEDREGTALDKVLFQDKLNQAGMITQMTGQPIMPDTVISNFERSWKAKNWFQKQAPQVEADQPENVQAQAEKVMNELQGMGGNQGQQIPDGLRRESTPKPSMATMAGQAQ